MGRLTRGLVALLLAGLRKKPEKNGVENTDAEAGTGKGSIVDDNRDR